MEGKGERGDWGEKTLSRKEKKNLENYFNDQ